ncbi:MAG: phosphoglucosamine mutase [Geminicoccaceae bacterium]
MTRKFFGTDGIRGRANRHPMTAELALKLGMAAGHLAVRDDRRHSVIIGKDTRLSGYMIEPALTAGFIAVGMDVILVGPLPTPAVAGLTRSLRADLGIMVSASHNPFEDNGIKVFGADGFKLSDALEREIEEIMEGPSEALLVDAPRLGRARRLEGAQGRYIESIKASFPRGMRLDGLKIVVDSAHGAAYAVAPKVLWELGATVIELGNKPDGTNINDGCGSTCPEHCAAAVRHHGADLGIALDGDADRVILFDEAGEMIDGDQVLAVIAEDWASDGRLHGGNVVATVMSNLGLELHLQGLGIGLARTKVGDRYVVEHMREHGCNVGGEQSGHVVLTDYATTGDGLLAALQVLAVLLRKDRPISEVGRPFAPLPQRLKNVRLNGGKPLEQPAVKAALADAESDLRGHGRILVRPSGTEPLVRVMVEADDEDLLHRVLDDVAAVIETHA